MIIRKTKMGREIKRERERERERDRNTKQKDTLTDEDDIQRNEKED